MLSGVEFVIGLLFVLALLFVSILDFSVTNANKVSVRRLAEGEETGAGAALIALLERRSEVLLSLQILSQLLLASCSVFVFGALSRRGLPYTAALPAAVGLMFAVILLFRQFLPRLIATRNPESIVARLSTLIRLCYLAMKPFSGLLMTILNYFHRWEEEMEPSKEEEVTHDEIQAFIDAGQEEGILEHDEGEMLQSIVDFGDKVAREVMTPRTQIIAIDVRSPVEKVVQLITGKAHSRIPVFRDDLDNIEGVIHERDLLRLWQRGDKPVNLRSLVRSVQFVPETKPVDDLLTEMKQKGDQMVLVVDEYGGISGLITMEDLIEEIVGEIHDAEFVSEKIVEESPGVFIVPGGLELDELDGALGTPFVEATECTTVAGAVVELFGRLPSPGEKIEHQGISVEVLDADRRRVHRLRMRLLAPKANSPRLRG